MATNYPVIRLTNGTKVWYARTFNWSSTNVQTGTALDSTLFTLPTGLPYGTYSLVVTANGIASDPISFVNGACTIGIKKNETIANDLSVYPNPADEQVTIAFTAKEGGNYSLQLLDVFGRIIKQEAAQSTTGDNNYMLNINGIAAGAYVIVFQKGEELIKTRIIIK